MSIETTVTDFDLADSQLLRAIQLYSDGDFICSIPLARNAEEICGKHVAKCGGRAVSGVLLEHFFGKGDPKIGKQKLKELIAALKSKGFTNHNATRKIKGAFSATVANRIRHAITHGIKDGSSITIDFESCAYRHISLAVMNRCQIKGNSPVPFPITRWFFEEFIPEEEQRRFLEWQESQDRTDTE